MPLVAILVGVLNGVIYSPPHQSLWPKGWDVVIGFSHSGPTFGGWGRQPKAWTSSGSRQGLQYLNEK